MDKIIFNVPQITGNEFRNQNRLIKYKKFSSSGYFTKKCKSWLIKNIKCKDALLVNSCTAALEMCALLINIKPGDEVIMPSFTFVSTANAFALRGAKIVFVDINKKTLNIDENLIEKNITNKTKAIVVVHYAGVSCEMDKILKIAKQYKIILIEDAAQAILSKYKNKSLGSFGDLSTFSFHETKNIHCGEGGALIINNKKFLKKAYIIKDKGTNRHEFDKDLIKKYSWVGVGSSYGLSEINTSFLYSQLKNAKKIIKKRIKIWNLYNKVFEKFEKQKKLLRPFIPTYSSINGHIFYIIVKKNLRNKILNYLKDNKIMALFHYIPLHNSPYGKKVAKINNNLKFTDLKSKSIIRLPLHLSIKEKDIEKIRVCFDKFFKQHGSNSNL
jgi:dTDP-4-amino-4,6-dideoxygalactose transaminase